MSIPAPRDGDSLPVPGQRNAGAQREKEEKWTAVPGGPPWLQRNARGQFRTDGYQPPATPVDLEP